MMTFDKKEVTDRDAQLFVEGRLTQRSAYRRLLTRVRKTKWEILSSDAQPA